MTPDIEAAQFSWASDRHLRIAFPSPAGDLLRAAHLAIQSSPPPGLISLTPALATFTLEFDLLKLDAIQALEHVRHTLDNASQLPPPPTAPLRQIPVCYDTSCAPDAAALAQLHDLTMPQLIDLHTAPQYVVQFVGFSPGFAYLSGLSPNLATPRLATPRTRVPAGSVGIAADMTGIYPRGSAGGWNLVGRTPLTMFDAGREPPCLLAAGDRVKFVPISLAEFKSQSRGRPDDA